MNTHRFRLIVFDCDGTLVDSQASIVAAMTHTFKALDLAPPSAAQTRRVVGLSLDEAIARLLPPESSSGFVAKAAESYKHYFLTARQREDHAEPLYPGVIETLRTLDTPDICLGIATGKSRRGLEATLDRHGLEKHFVTLQTADHGPGKPHPRMLHEAMRDVGASPAETVLVGDTVFDMEMAQNAGTAAIGVAWGYHEPGELAAAGARHILTQFTDIPASLQEIATSCA